ncbi:putative entry exclusion protein TrbK-alt [Bradyrhizobium sp. RDT46]|uniref:putative entry exclusion protein TrbK-alt n=1 Tax=Bradyrhizobium sp. RDT46 TaxID=3341829 RepID=UPI0035C6BFAC
MLARLGAIAFVAIAITATVVELTRKEQPPALAPARQAPRSVTDPLQAELLRCQSLGESGPRNPACLRAWAESRRRFLTPSAPGSQGGSGSTLPNGEAPGEAGAPNGE